MLPQKVTAVHLPQTTIKLFVCHYNWKASQCLDGCFSEDLLPSDRNEEEEEDSA